MRNAKTVTYNQCDISTKQDPYHMKEFYILGGMTPKHCLLPSLSLFST